MKGFQVNAIAGPPVPVVLFRREYQQIAGINLSSGLAAIAGGGAAFGSLEIRFCLDEVY